MPLLRGQESRENNYLLDSCLRRNDNNETFFLFSDRLFRGNAENHRYRIPTFEMLMTSLVVKCSGNYIPERKYILQYILSDLLGIGFSLEIHDIENTEITCERDDHSKKLIIADHLFNTAPSEWLTSATLPESPLKRWKVPKEESAFNILPEDLPIIYGEFAGSESLFKIKENRIELGLDVFGSAFFMLTRYEEAVKDDLDGRQRFPLSATLGFREKFHAIPIINCYVELLWRMMQKLWNGLERKKREYRVIVSHDVDNPLSYAWQTVKSTLRSAAGDIIRRKSVLSALKRMSVSALSGAGYWDRRQNVSEKLLKLDPGYNLKWIMDTNEEFNLKSCFNFIAGHTGGAVDGSYSLEWDWLKKLLKRISVRGHEIGLHPSYNSYLDGNVLSLEFKYLKEKCHSLAIHQAEWGGRQHYLRWSNPETWQNWEDAGLQYDSSVGFAESPGFRSGICQEYPVFNLLTKKKLKLTEKPLIFMDASVLDYMQGSYDDVVDVAVKFSRIVKRFSGDFTLLHHNCRLVTNEARSGYKTILAEII